MFFFFSSRRRHTRYIGDWSSDVCSSDLIDHATEDRERHRGLDVLQPIFERFDGADHVESLAGAAGAGNDADSAATNAEAFERSEERRVGKECQSRWGRGR